MEKHKAQQSNPRRDFIKKSLLGAGAFFVSFSPLKIFAENTFDNTSESASLLSLREATQLAKKAKELFYKKEYESATNIYKQIITAYPSEIEFYDAYAKVLNAQQKSLEVAELFKEGLVKNEGNPYFMQRLSLSIRTICTGNSRAVNEFIANYHSSDTLYESAALLMLDAINKIPDNKGFYYDLRDFVKISTERKHKKELHLSENLSNQILSITSPVEKTWGKSRESIRPTIIVAEPKQGLRMFRAAVDSESRNSNIVVSESDIEVIIENIENKNRRQLYIEQESKVRQASIRKTKKAYWHQALNKNIKEKKLNKAERYGMLILGENINDSNTVGKLRNLYKKAGEFDKLLSLNRYLYINDSNIPNTLALALVLAKHGNKKSYSEVDELLKTIESPEDLISSHATSYYLADAYVKIKSNNTKTARVTLLDGIKQLVGKSKISLSLFECYALSYNKKNNFSIGVDILKALSGENIKEGKDPVWNYVKEYIQYNHKNMKIDERLKPLYALAKLQEKHDRSGHSLTISEIERLKSKVTRNLRTETHSTPL